MTPKNCATEEYRERTGTKAMTKELLKSKVLTVMKEVDYERLVDKAISSGAIDIGSHNENDNGLLAIIMCYVYYELYEKCQPFTKEDKKELANLLKF